jgi:hypothetical protein
LVLELWRDVINIIIIIIVLIVVVHHSTAGCGGGTSSKDHTFPMFLLPTEGLRSLVLIIKTRHLFHKIRFHGLKKSSNDVVVVVVVGGVVRDGC